MGWFGKYINSSVGAKQVMAITGLMLVGFVLMHMLGNLQIYAGQDAVNSYAATLKALGPLLWVARVIILVVFIVHVRSAIRLSKMNRAARPVKYHQTSYEKSSYASRTMVMSGIILLAFIVFHLAHLTFHIGPMSEALGIDQYGRPDVYTMTVLGFQKIPVSIAYIAAMVLLCLHLSHGITSFFQTLGMNHPKYNSLFKLSGPMIAGLIFIGNCSMPIAVLAKLVKVTV